jgi:ADP-heptose:LPS heptosyltransferase
VGYGITGGGFLLHQCLRLRPAAHEVERDLDLIRSLGQGMHLPQAYAPLALSAEELSQGLAFWQTRKPHVVIHPGAGDPVKCWPPEHFSRLCRALGAACEILVVGSAGEQGLAEQVVQGSGPGVRNVAGQTPLRMLASMIAGADLFIGNDSGPGHIAVTQGIPVVMLWSETNEPDEWGPWGAGVQASVIRNPSRPEALEEALTAGRAYLAQKGRQS